MVTRSREKRDGFWVEPTKRRSSELGEDAKREFGSAHL
jgi:hypothetical protein